jgi:CheY-like chemotaxis protein
MAQQIANLPARDAGDGEDQVIASPSQDALMQQLEEAELPALEEGAEELVGTSPNKLDEPFVGETLPPPFDTVDVLVCEDNEVNQIVFAQILQSGGYRFEIANDGVEGVAAYKNYSPSLVLMDVSMPNMNGLEATAEIRRQDAVLGKHTPIIGVTAHAIKGDMESCLEAGMDDYLSKPVSPDKLQEKILMYLSATPVSDSMAG